MRIQIKGKIFQLELSHGFLKIGEFYNNRKRWINIPVKLFEWVSGVLKDCSKLIEFEHSRRFGCLWWKIQSGCNRWGWFLKLSVQIKGIWYSVFVPALSSGNPWRSFVHAFLHVAQEKSKVVAFDDDCHDACLDSLFIVRQDDSPLYHDYELKLEVDILLNSENLQMTYYPPNIVSKDHLVKEPSMLNNDPSKNIGVVKEKMLASSERLLGSVSLSDNASAFANGMCTKGVSVCTDGDENSTCAKGIGSKSNSVGVVSEGSIFSLDSAMSNVVPSTHFRRSTKKNQCQLLNHLGFSHNMQKKNGIQVSKRCSEGYPNG